MDFVYNVPFWGKYDSNSKKWHPLLLHMVDVAICAEAILLREPPSSRERIAHTLGMTWDIARPWILLIIACHDLGKACPGFQFKWDGAKELLAHSGLKIPGNPDTTINHAFVGQIVLANLLVEQGWPNDLSELISDAVGCHHGVRASSSILNNLEGNKNALGRDGWDEARRKLFEAMITIFKPTYPPSKLTLSGPDFMLVSGIASFADWIGSNDFWFTFGSLEDCSNLSNWCVERHCVAERSLDQIGWMSRSPLSLQYRTFENVFEKTPRPLQESVAEVVANIKRPCILLVEAPMGEGKTEAAFYAHLELQRQLGHRGLYVALPTKATGNAMFKRTLKFLHDIQSEKKLDLQLLHGAVLLNDTFQALRFANIYSDDDLGKIRAGEWFTHKKRALLSEYGVGTVDQAILPILPVRHHFVRLWGLANRVVVFDEIHAYDAYTGTLLLNLIGWLQALGSSVILLSATLPPKFRRDLAKIAGEVLPEKESCYPRLSIFGGGNGEKIVVQKHFKADPRFKRKIKLIGISPALNHVHDRLREMLSSEGFGLVLLNTVQRAQELYRIFGSGELLDCKDVHVGKRLADGTEVYLFHARYPAQLRQIREDKALDSFGEKSIRENRKILIATQVVEQSLDLDFDIMISDLAPIDLILQRAGRLWRHLRTNRPVVEPILMVTGLNESTPPSFDKPLWWGKVYREDLLLRTWNLLKNKNELLLPDEIETLVQAVYEGSDEDIPIEMQDRLWGAECEGVGRSISQRDLANGSHIGFPDDSSWKNSSYYAKADEDVPGLHPSLVARTRLGESSAEVIPLFTEDGFMPEIEPNFEQSKKWSMRSLSLTRKGVVNLLFKLGIPEGWKKSPLLRNSYPLVLDAENFWIEDRVVRLDEELGLVYQDKETNE